MNVARTRATILVIGVLLAVAAIAYYQGRNVEVYLPWLWPAWLAVAAVACFVFAWRLDSPRWWQASRILTVIGVLSRVASIAFRAVKGELASSWSGVGSSAIYMLAAVVLYRVWDGDFRYWSRRAAGSRQ